MDKEMNKLVFKEEKIFHELNFLKEDQELIDYAEQCLQLYKEFYSDKGSVNLEQNKAVKEKVSERTLAQILSQGRDIHGIKTNREISNVRIFSLQELKTSPHYEEMIRLGNSLDQIVFDRLRKLFITEKDLLVSNSGRFWYPKGGYMGWHTNSQAPGWRFYINHAEETSKSFFRYRDPETLSIVTSWDERWNFRLFRIDPEKVLWHAIYADTNRFSLGYKVEEKSNYIFPIRVLKRAGKAFINSRSNR